MGAYGAGGPANNLLAAGSGGMMIALNLGYGMNPALVGLLGALPRLTDAITQSERTLFLMRLFDVTVPFAASILAILLIASYGITKERAREIRATLEQRRGRR